MLKSEDTTKTTHHSHAVLVTAKQY